MGDSGSPLSASLGDPALDIAGLYGLECFLCGSAIVHVPSAGWYGKPGLPQLPVHRDCFHRQMAVANDLYIALEYHRRVEDIINVPRRQ